MYRFLLLITIVLCFTGCKKDQPVVFPNEFTNGLFFVNEGQFQQANASLSFYDVENDTIFNNAYQTVNNQPIGDILQSVNYDDNNLYLVVNNSGKIIVADKQTLKYKGEITGLPSPRYMEYSGTEDLWYVSDLSSDSLFVVNTSNYTIERTEYIGNRTEAMKTINNKLYISSSNSDQLYVKNLATNSLDSILVKLGGSNMFEDNENNLRLLCSGDYNITGSATIYKINTNELRVIGQRNIFEGYPAKLIFDKPNNTAYYINNHIYRYKLDSLMSEEIFIEATGQNFYGVNVIGESIFVTDALDFISNGLVYEYDENGELLKTHTSGINPNAVVTIP